MAFFVCCTENLQASHSMGSDLTYRCLGGNTYEITLSFYRDCVGVPADGFANIILSSSCYPAFSTTIYPITGTGNEISPLCPSQTSTCSGGTFTGVQEYIYRGIVNLPGPCTDWTFGYNLCCRNNAITNINIPGGTQMYVFATLNNVAAPCNNSPTFGNRPVPFVCQGQQYCYNHGAYDSDGDSLVYTLITPYDSPNLNIQYRPPFSASNPLTSNPAMSFNPQTGDICMTPTNLEVTVMAVLVREYRNGVLIGSVERDIQVTVINCNNQLPAMSGINGTSSFSQTICAGTQTCFNLFSSDPNTSQNTYVSWDYSIPGATFTVIPGNRQSASFCWTPTQAQISSNPYCFTVTVEDDNCPYLGSQVFSYCIIVSGLNVNAGPDVSVGCNSTVNLSATAIGGSGNYTYSWNNGASGQSISAGPGTYIVTASDGLCSRQDTVVVNPGSATPVAAFNMNFACSGLNVQFNDQSSISGGNISSWTWDFGDGTGSTSTSPSHTYAAAGTYQVTLTVQTAGGCIDTQIQTLVIAPSIPAAAFSLANVCLGEQANFMDASTSSSAITNWSWNFGDGNSSTIPNPANTYAAAGNYNISLTITNADGCTSSITQPLTVYPLPIANAGTSQTICEGGSVNLSGNGGVTYVWNPGAISSQNITVTPTQSITYTLEVTDVNGCTNNADVDVTVHPLPQANAGPDQTVCDGSVIMLSASGGGPGPNTNTYTWNPGNLNGRQVTVTPVSNTIYILTVTSVNGCVESDSVAVTVNTLPIAITSPDQYICNGESATLSASGGLNYTWNPGGFTSQTINVSPNVNSAFLLTITDINGCQDTATVFVNINPNPLASFTHPPVSCVNSNFTFTNTSQISSGSLSFDWTFGSLGNSTDQNPVLNVVSTGTFNVLLTVTSDSGCVHTASSSFIGAPLPVASFSSIPVCQNNPSVFSNSSTISNNDPLNYYWNFGDGNTSTIQSPSHTYLSNGNFNVQLIVVSPYGCSDSIIGSTSVYSVPSVILTGTNVLCNGGNTGSVSANVNSGTGPFAYTWSPGGNGNQSLSQIGIGIYAVTVTDQNGCTANSTMQINEPPALNTSTISTDALCFGSADGTATVNASGGTPGYTYIWSGSAGTMSQASGLQAGNYTVIVTDANGCTTSNTANINQPTAINLNTSSTPASCGSSPNGTASVNATGGMPGYTYYWSPTGSTNASAGGLVPGTYTVTVTDGNLCTTTASALVGNIGGPTASGSVLTHVACFAGSDGSAAVSASAGTPPYSYNWLPFGGNSNTASNLIAGNYTVQVTDDDGCITVVYLNISEPPALVATSTSTNVQCNGMANGSISLSASGGTAPYFYSWNPQVSNSSNATGLSPGSYSVFVTDANGCGIQSSTQISEPAILSISTSNTDASCFGLSDGTATVSSAGGTTPHSYNWTSLGITNQQISGLPSGTYSVIVTDANSCTQQSSVNIQQPTPLQMQVSGSGTICINQYTTISASVSGGTSPYFYFWSNGVTDSIQTISPDSATIYSVSVTDQNGCSLPAQQISVDVYPALSLTISDPLEICAGEPASISAVATGGNGGPYVYTWNSGAITGPAHTVYPMTDSAFTVIVTDGCGSPTVTQSVIILVEPAPVAQFLPQSIIGCTPVYANFQDYSFVPPGTVYTWNLGDGTSSSEQNPSHIYTIPGEYDVSLNLVSETGCTSSMLIPNAVIVYGYPVADFQQSADEVSIFQPIVNFTDNSFNAIRFEWDFGDGSDISFIQHPVHEYTDTGTYIVRLIVTSIGGCTDTIYSIIRVEQEFTIYVPNAFTPNGDGINDFFIAQGIGWKSYEMWILDRWGLKIFHCTSTSQPWDGTYFGNGNVCQTDVYEYVIDVFDYKDQKHRVIGHVTLFR